MKTIENLNEFLTLVEKNECTSGLTIYLGNNELGTVGAQRIATALQSGSCPSELTIDLRDNNLGVEGTQHIAAAMQSGNCPEGLTINLGYNKLGAEGAQHIATALQSGKCPNGLAIDLRGNNLLGAGDARHIAAALQSGNCPNELTIHLEDNDLGAEDAQHIAAALQSENCPDGLTINLGNNDLGPAGAKHIATALQSGKCPSGLTINLEYNRLGAEGAQHIAAALQSENCPSRLTINLVDNNLGAVGAQHIAAALQSGNCPSGLTINIGNNNLGAVGAHHIATALQSGKYPSRLTIDLEYNNLGAEGAQHIAIALQSGKCPSGLTINFGYNGLGAEGAKHIATALQSGKCPSGLTIINFLGENLDINSVSSLAETIMHRNLPADLCLDLNEQKYSVTLEQPTILVKALFASPYNIDKGLRLKGMPKVNLAFQKLLQDEAKYEDNSKANPQACNPDTVATRLACLINLYNSLDTLFPEEEILPETSLAILQSFGTLLSRYEPAYQPSTDTKTVKAHYQYLDKSLLPLIVNWHKKLLNQSNIIDAHRQQFIEGCECLANLYNTNFDNELLLKEEDKASSQRAERQLAQRALAMRVKLYRIANQHRKESNASDNAIKESDTSGTLYHATLLRLAESLSGKALTLQPLGKVALDKLKKQSHAFDAYRSMLDVWENGVASKVPLRSALSVEKAASGKPDAGGSSALNISHVTLALATSHTTSATSSTGATSATSSAEATSAARPASDTSSQTSHYAHAQRLFKFNQPSSSAKNGAMLANQAVPSYFEALMIPLASKGALAASANNALEGNQGLNSTFKTHRRNSR